MQKIEIKSAEQFDQEIAKGNTVVDFYATWCNPCRMLGPVLEEVLKDKDVKLLKVDVDNLGELASRYDVFSIPNVFLFKDGLQVGNFVGFKYASEVDSLVKNAFGI